jgi:DeoR family suf operon transcriptional repressor
MTSLNSSPLQAFSQRQQSLVHQLLVERDGQTADELADHLGISRSAVDQQLKGLERDGYLEKYQRPSTGGRPSYAYRLTTAGFHLFPKHYALFSDLLISLIKDESGSRALTDYLEGLAASLAGQFKARISGKDPSTRIHQVAQLMQELGYEAEALPERQAEKKDKKGPLIPVIQAHNCVYHHLAAQHEEICKLDLALIGNLLDAEVEQMECMVRGGRACRFRVKTPEANN